MNPIDETTLWSESYEPLNGIDALLLPNPNGMAFVEPLTGREREVLAHVARGKTLEESARQLEISRNTAHTHLKHVYQKLGISSRAEATAAAMRLRLIRL